MNAQSKLFQVITDNIPIPDPQADTPPSLVEFCLWPLDQNVQTL